MLAVGLSLVAGLGFASAAILARVGMQGVKPLSSSLISTVASLLPSAALALAFALSDIRALPPIAFLWLLVLGGVNFLGGRTQSYLAIDILGASRSSAILGSSTVFAALFAISLLFGVILLWPLAGRAAVQDLTGSGGDRRLVGFAAFSGLAAATAVICLYYALQRAEVVVVSPIVSTNPLITLLLAKIFIAQLENITRRVLLGTTFAVMGVLLVIIGSTL